ncbi:hypothetical protein Nepgr_021708 [Nepenthes gracilis]|uniref:Uncharacterized protein n=1 Tax=Nepenthes gracilis TaxID=150966 RepID=A0AAD3SZE0_NEPGR|nr:hypothetical protein Nepgr_021708 [Nepenthes gracilis]
MGCPHRLGRSGSFGLYGTFAHKLPVLLAAGIPLLARLQNLCGCRFWLMWTVVYAGHTGPSHTFPAWVAHSATSHSTKEGASAAYHPAAGLRNTAALAKQQGQKATYGPLHEQQNTAPYLESSEFAALDNQQTSAAQIHGGFIGGQILELHRTTAAQNSHPRQHHPLQGTLQNLIHTILHNTAKRATAAFHFTQ